MNEDELKTTFEYMSWCRDNGLITARELVKIIELAAANSTQTKVGPKAGKQGPQVRVRQDARGVDLLVGTRVAFNYSGQVAIGVIEKITPNEYHIKRETHTTGYGTSNPVSKVKNAYSILAINEVADVEAARRELQRQAREDYATANKDFLKMIANAWDLDDILLGVEEKYGKDWKDKL